MALRKIKPQFIGVPEGQLMYAVVDQAIRDLFFAEKDADQCSAVKYLSGRIPQAFASGVNSEWIKDLLKKLQLLGHQND